jgi:hypothetical protein
MTRPGPRDRPDRRGRRAWEERRAATLDGVTADELIAEAERIARGRL